jgi:hypothetical protein
MLDWLHLLRQEREMYLALDEERPKIVALELDYQSSIARWEGYDFAEREYAETHSNPLSALRHYVEIGIPTPPELLNVIARVYGDYYSAHGDLELEEAFFGKRKRGVGNYSAQMHQKGSAQAFGPWLARGKKQRKSDVEIAEEYISHFELRIDPESVIRAFKRNRELKPDK